MKKTYDMCYCNYCKQERKVEILFEYELQHDEDYLLKDIYYLVKCEKCSSIFIKRIIDEWWDVIERTIMTIPPTNIAHDKFYNYFNNNYHQSSTAVTPYHVFKMYREILAAINSKSFWLAFCGMRSLIEQICQNIFNTKPADFKEMEKQISQASIISDTIKPVIIRILDATHSSIHRTFFPEQDQIVKCLNVIEEFLEQIYILPQIGDTIEKAKLPNKTGRITDQ